VIATTKLTNSYPSRGRFVSWLDVRNTPVLHPRSEIKRELFGVEDALGKSIKIGEENFRVAGVMGEKNYKENKTSAIKIRNINRDIYIPITTAMKRFTDADYPNRVEEIAVQVDKAQQVVRRRWSSSASRSATHYGVADYEVIIPEELLAQSQRTQRIFNIVMGRSPRCRCSSAASAS
jgi:putative ABC transport system permease protein